MATDTKLLEHGMAVDNAGARTRASASHAGDGPEGSDTSRRNVLSKANPKAAAAIAAAVLAEDAQMTGDPEIARQAAEAAENAGEVGAPELLDADAAAELADRGIALRPSAPPVSLTAPWEMRSLTEPPAAEEPDEEDDEYDEEVDLDPAVPADIAALLADDDEEAETEEEPEPDEEDDEEVADLEPDPEDVSYYDENFIPEGSGNDELRELRKQNAKLQKRIAAQERQRAAGSRATWKDEAERFFPCASPFLDEIDASSRKEYLRQAQAVHERNLPYVQAQVAQANAEARQAKATAREEARQGAREAWGTPLVTTAPMETSQSNADLERNIARARQRGGLAGQMTEKVRSGLFGRL